MNKRLSKITDLNKVGLVNHLMMKIGGLAYPFLWLALVGLTDLSQNRANELRRIISPSLPYQAKRTFNKNTNNTNNAYKKNTYDNNKKNKNEKYNKCLNLNESKCEWVKNLKNSFLSVCISE